jgi:hypothetical protein
MPVTILQEKADFETGMTIAAKAHITFDRNFLLMHSIKFSLQVILIRYYPFGN